MKLAHFRKVRTKATLAIALALIMSLASIMPLFASVDDAWAGPSGISAVPGELFSWGINHSGSTGLGTSTGNTVAPTQVGTDSSWTAISAGSSHSLAINSSGELFSWGPNWSGITGLGTASGDTLVPTRVGTASNWTAVAAGGNHSLAINSQGELWSWGSNGFGQTGFGTTSGNTLVPTRVGTASNWTAVSAGGNHSLAVNSNGELFVWGSNWSGATGLGITSGNTLVPTRIGTASNWTTVSAGNTHSLAMNAQGELWAWGSNWGGVTGLGIAGDDTLTPTRVGTASNWTTVSTACYHSLAINAQGELWAWGSNGYGATGLGTFSGDTLTPTRVGTASDWTAVAAGHGHSLAINAQGELFSWGTHDAGQTGLGTASGGTPTPTRVGEVSNWTAVAASLCGAHSLAIAGDPIPQTLPPTLITKSLQLNEGVSVPDLSFNFAFTPTRTVLVEAEVGPPPVAEILSTEHTIAIPPQSITINSTSYDTSTLAGGVLTKTNYLDIASLIEAIDFPNGGIFSWLVTETPDATGYSTPPSHIAYSQAVYELRVHANRYGVPTLVEIVVVTPDNDSQTVGAKEDGMLFTNIYTRQVGTDDLAALVISKEIPSTEGNSHANLSTDFTFTLTLTNPVHTSDVAPAITFPLNAYVYEGTTRIRTETITSLTHTFDLRHDQRFIIPNLPAGATFTVSEDPTVEFTPNYRVYLRGDFVVANAGTTGNVLTTGTHFIDTGRNAAEFTNNHQWIPPMGLVITNIPFALIGLVAVLLVLMLAKRQRRTIEEMPIV